MAVLIAGSTQKKVFNKNIITIGSTPDCDFIANIGSGQLILQYSQNHNKYLLQNKSALSKPDRKLALFLLIHSGS